MIRRAVSSILVARDTITSKPRSAFKAVNGLLPTLGPPQIEEDQRRRLRPVPGQQRAAIHYSCCCYSYSYYHHTQGRPRRQPHPSAATQLFSILVPRSTNTPSFATSRRNRNRSRSLSATARRAMASDEDYLAFLDKANRDPNEGIGTTAKTEDEKKKQTVAELKATDEGAQIPAAILDATKDAFYVSDADEPFVPVCLAWEDEGGKKGLPDEEEFAALIQHPDPTHAGIEIQDPADWDPRGQYAQLLDAVRRATRGADARVYRVPHGGGARVEYWVVAAEGDGGGDGSGARRLLGVKALAVES